MSRHVVISGGGSGVGAALAQVFADQGDRVTLLGRRLAPLETVAAPLGGTARSCDVTDRAAIDAALADLPPVDVAIANAGAAPSMPFAQMRAEDLDGLLGVNLHGVVNLWQAALPTMHKSGSGRLIAIASTAGLKGYPYVSGYCAAKHAVVGLTRALAIELGKSGITANAICPGFIDTPLLDRAIETIREKTGLDRDAAVKSLVRGNPQARLIAPAEVAAAALWLASDAAAAINGHALAMSGGEI